MRNDSQVIIAVIVLLHFTDKLPLYLTALLVVSHVVHLQNFGPKWPVISLVSPFFILSCLLVLASHFASFRYFSERGRRNTYGRYRAGYRNDDTFLDVATFFGVCVWLVPFFLFLSLSANDNVLPSSSGSSSGRKTPVNGTAQPNMSPTSARHARHQSSLIKTALSRGLGMLPFSTSRRRNEGLIAPPSPALSSASTVHSPWESGQYSPVDRKPPPLQMPPRRPSDLPRRPSASPHQRSASGSYSMPLPHVSSSSSLQSPVGTPRPPMPHRNSSASSSLADFDEQRRAASWSSVSSQQPSLQQPQQQQQQAPQHQQQSQNSVASSVYKRK